MLRRIKRDVEQEIAEKIEVELPCTLTPKQQLFYSKLKNKINISDLVEKSHNNPENSVNLINLVMQFRKVCNHPELFHRSDIVTPYSFSSVPQSASPNYTPIIARYRNPISYTLPRLVYDECSSIVQPRQYLEIFTASNIDGGLASNHCFSFLQLTSLTPSQLSIFATKNIFQLWDDYLDIKLREESREFCSEVMKLLPRSHIALPKMNSYLIANTILSEFIKRPLERLDDFKWMFQRCLVMPKAYASPIDYYCNSSHFFISSIQHEQNSPICKSLLLGKSLKRGDYNNGYLTPIFSTYRSTPASIPEFNNLISDSGKLQILDKLLNQLKMGGHRCLVYSQMTKMIDILEEFMMFRKYKYIRLDGTSKLSERRDMVDDWQSKYVYRKYLFLTFSGRIFLCFY
jgi:DNA helicase INO80